MDTKKTLTVKEWADEDKPREKLITQGKKSLTTAELIAILIRSGVPGKSAVDVAKEVLQLAGNRLTDLSHLEHSKLAQVKGLGTAKAATLLAALELGWRMQGELGAEKEWIINDSQTLFNYVMPLIIDLDHEEFWCIHLSNRRKVIGRQRVSAGGITETTVDLRLLFRAAIENRAVQIAVAHNHPSGILTPSSADIRLTKQIEKAGEILGIKLLDHIIVSISSDGKPHYYSFRDNDKL